MIKSLQNKHDGFRLSLYLLNNVKFKLPFVNNSFLPNWAGQKSMKGSTFPFIFMQKKSKAPESFLIFSVLMLSALVIELRWYAEVLDFRSQNWKIIYIPQYLLNVEFKIKINLSSRFGMMQCSTEARGRNTMRNITRKWSSGLNSPCFDWVCHSMW